MQEKQKILISGNWDIGIEAVKGGLKGEPYRLEVCASDDLKNQMTLKHDLLILALESKNLMGKGALITEMTQEYDALPVIIVSQDENWESVVDLMKAGARDYLVHPFNKEKLKKAVAHYTKMYRLTKKIFFTDEQGGLIVPFENMIGSSEPMQEIFKVITAVAKSNATVLIGGESGTGKELVAKAIHRKSERAGYRFIDLNCGAIPKDLLENELFGHEKGAFTGAHARYHGSFEVAHKGSLFLDEISEMDPLLQVKLLRLLQERSFMRIGGTEKIDVDVRIIAATNRHLQEEISRGRFREDLYYRLNVVNIMMPPLRERREDIPLIAKHFLEYYSAKNSRIFIDFTDDAMEALVNYDWPGNVRELENTIERVVVLHNSTQVKLKYLPKHIQKVNRAIPFTKGAQPLGEESHIIPLDELERKAIEVALMKFNNNISIVSKKLKIGQATLYRKVKKYGLAV